MKQTRIIGSVGLGDHYILKAELNNVIKNTKQFNLGQHLTYKTETVPNGEQFRVYKDGKMFIEWALLGDTTGWELTATTYKDQK